MDKVKIRLFYFFLPAFVLLEKMFRRRGGLLKFYFSLFSKNEEKNVLRNVNVVVAAVHYCLPNYITYFLHPITGRKEKGAFKCMTAAVV